MTKILTPTDVSERLGLSIPFLKQQARHGEGPTYFLNDNKKVRFREEDVAEYERDIEHIYSIVKH
ncbi:MAG: helix-turn-helix transcriptional regulator [Planktomarina sp.]